MSTIPLKELNEDKQLKIDIHDKEGTLVDITFKNLSYRITARDGKSLDIIKNITANYNHSQLCAIMGPSGAGKTTLVRSNHSHFNFNFLTFSWIFWLVMSMVAKS